VTFEFNLKGDRRAAIAALAATLLLGSVGTVNAEPQAQSWIVGTWVLAAADKLLPDGARVPDYGPNPHGICVFTSDGYYSLQIYRTDRLKFSSGEKFSGTPEEYKDVSLGMSVGFGRYNVDPVKHTITFHRDRNSVPNLDGTTGEDTYELNGDELSWKVAPRKDGSILATGVAAHLKEALPNLEATQLRPLAERIAAGDNVSVPGLTAPIVHEALANGFGWVMLYGGIGVWIMARISFLIFNAGAVRQPKVQPSE
jgi:hypothetical protein